MELSLRRLRMLRELHRRGTVTAAASALHYTPSAVSQQLAQLEREVGVTLVERHGRGVQLTELGLVLTEHAEEILASVERASAALESAQAGVSARLTMGVWASVAATLVPAALAALATDHPGIEVRTRELAPEDTAGAVRDGALDLSFVIDYSDYPMPWDPGLGRSVVGVERIHAAVPTGVVPEASITLHELAEHPWILAGPRSHFGRAIRIAAQRAGCVPRVTHEVGEQFTAIAMVAGGLGVTLVSDLGAVIRPAGVDVVALSEPLLRTISLAHRITTPPRRTLALVVDAVRAAAVEHGIGVGGALPGAGEPSASS